MKVKNRSASVVGYLLPELNVRRRFAPGEVKDLPFEEIEKLLYQPGGRSLFLDNLQIPADDMKKLGFEEQEPEYYYGEEEIKKLMTSSSLDQFLDALDFLPEGGINLIKDLSVKLPLTDMNKIEALKNKTGYDAGKAIAHNKAVEKELKGEGAEAVAEQPQRKRRVDPINGDKYKVIEQ